MLALERSPLGAAMRSSLWLFPAVETLHIFGLAMLVGSIVSFDLRVLGLTKTVSVRALERHVVPWALASFALVAATGITLASTKASEYYSNPALRLKLILIVVAGLNALVFHRSVYKRVAEWDTRADAPRGAKLGALASIALWLAVITCGRMIAYV